MKNTDADDSSPAPSKNANALFLGWSLELGLDKNWTEADNEAVSRHFVKLQQLQKEGKLIIAGRTLVKESMGVVILEAESEAEARKVMDNDDAVQAGIMSAEVFPFQTALSKAN